MKQRDEIPPGTLYMLILRTLSRGGEMHGYEIAKSIQQISNEVLTVEEGSLYPALQRMLLKGWIMAEWGTGEPTLALSAGADAYEPVGARIGSSRLITAIERLLSRQAAAAN